MSSPQASASEIIVDGMQYGRWSETMFQQMRQGGVSVVHVTVAYHENFRDTVDLLIAWNARFRRFSDLIAPAGTLAEIDDVVGSGRTAIVFGLQNPSPIEADIGLLEVLYDLGIRFMQLSYNNQSLLCGGWKESVDSGLTNMGREVVREMNRLGMVIDMSHSAERSTLETIDASERPIVVSHANPFSWRETGRNKSATVLKALTSRGGLVGLSLYPDHMRDGSGTALEEFARMAGELGDLIGPEHIGIGSDLCQDQPPSVLAWMREGKWRWPSVDDAQRPPFPPQAQWFRNNLDFARIRGGLEAAGFSAAETSGILGRNWYEFLQRALRPGSGEAAAAGNSRRHAIEGVP